MRPRLSRQVNPPWPHFCAGPGASSISDLTLSHRNCLRRLSVAKGQGYRTRISWNGHHRHISHQIRVNLDKIYDCWATAPEPAIRKRRAAPVKGKWAMKRALVDGRSFKSLHQQSYLLFRQQEAAFFLSRRRGSWAGDDPHAKLITHGPRPPRARPFPVLNALPKRCGFSKSPETTTRRPGGHPRDYKEQLALEE